MQKTKDIANASMFREAVVRTLREVLAQVRRSDAQDLKGEQVFGTFKNWSNLDGNAREIYNSNRSLKIFMESSLDAIARGTLSEYDARTKLICFMLKPANQNPNRIEV